MEKERERNMEKERERNKNLQ